MAGKATGRSYMSRLLPATREHVREGFDKNLNNASIGAMYGLDVNTVGYERDHRYDTPKPQPNHFSLT
jgi:hypothetical protein